MRRIQKYKKLEKLLKQSMFRTSEAREAGVSASLLAYYVKTGRLERVGRGLYRVPGAVMKTDFQWEDLVIMAKSIPGGVVCLVSALSLYEMTDEIPRAHWIAVSNATTAPKYPGARIIRMRNMTLGLSEMKVGEETIRIFDRERCIVDAFRYLSKEIAIKAFKESLRSRVSGKIDLRKLQRYAKKMRVNLVPYILALTT